MKPLFLYYPSCSTCKKAKKWLDDKGIPYDERDIKVENPTAKEMEEWIHQSGLPIKRFFNTSGLKYRELALKDKLLNMSKKEQYEILGSDGMLVKRPLFILDDQVLVRFKEQEWEEALL